MTRKQQWIVAAATILVAPLLGAGTAAASIAARPAQLGTISAVATSPVKADDNKVVAAATIGNQAKIARLHDAPATGPVKVTPNRGEGIISIVKRTCGSSSTWRANAAANNIRIDSNPPWLVLFGQSLTVDCGLQVVAAATNPEPPAQQPAPQQPAVQNVSALWFHPLPGHCRPHGGGGDFHAPRDGYLHQGVDLQASSGTPIHAVGGGQIIYAGYSGGAGNQIQQRIGNVVFKYNHLSKFERTGGFAYPGEVIGYVGTTGRSSGPHLHLEAWVNGQNVNSADWLYGAGVRGMYC